MYENAVSVRSDDAGTRLMDGEDLRAIWFHISVGSVSRVFRVFGFGPFFVSFAGPLVTTAEPGANALFEKLLKYFRERELRTAANNTSRNRFTPAIGLFSAPSLLSKSRKSTTPYQVRDIRVTEPIVSSTRFV